jgi:hypothetical protein
MNEVLKYNQVESKLLNIRNQQVLLDSDVAELYEVETKRINEAVKNNPDKFPYGYVIELNDLEFEDLRSKFSTANLTKTRINPKAFTEKGLYMLSTILKSKRATDTTIDIIETFTKLRTLQKTVSEIIEVHEEHKQKSLMQKSSEIISEILGDSLDATETETTIELNFAVLKVKHTFKRKNAKDEVHEDAPIYIKLKD